MANVMVIAELAQGKIKKTTLSALTFGKTLAKKVGGDVIILVLGKGVKEAAGELSKYGAKKVVVVDNPNLEHYIASNYAPVVVEAANQTGSYYVAAASTAFGRDLLPQVAARMGAGMVSDCIAIVGDAPPLRFKRPMWAGNVIATVAVNTEKAVFGVRAAEFEAAPQVDTTSPVEDLPVEVTPDPKVRFVGFAATISERPDLTEARIVVSGGRGLRDKEGFWGLLNPLADVLNAAIGATRAVVDAGIAPNDLQIGQTGKVVAPDLYIAVALSGAIQHLAGMKNSKVIVAINKDEEAPIFSVADYGLVADAFKAVPELVDELKKAKA